MILVATLLLGGCVKKSPAGLDPELPEESGAVEAQAPRLLLEEFAASDDPSLRARALPSLVTADPETWGPRGLFDPDGWVQRQVARALLGRPEGAALLDAFVARSSGDVYARTEVALARPAAPIVEAWRAEPDRYRAAPLAYGAVAHGESEALAGLVQAVSRGELALEEDFVRSLGQCRTLERVPSGACDGLLDALKAGEEWVEEELHLAYGAARMRLGDPSGEQLLRRGLGGDVRMQVATLDHLALLESPEATALLNRAESSSESLVRSYAGLVLASRGAGGIEPFQQAASAPTDELRALAARFIGVRLARGERKSARQLEQLLDTLVVDRATDVRQAALEASITADLTDPARYERALTDESPAIRILAAGRLLQQGP